MSKNIKIPDHVWSLLMQHANYDKALVERSLEKAQKKAGGQGVTTQKILDEIWSEVDK